MGNRLAKPPPFDRPIAPPPAMRGRGAQIPRPFPPLTAQAYLPGGGMGGYPSFPPFAGTLEPPIMNFSGGPGMLPPPTQFPPMLPPPAPFLPPPPPPMPYPTQAITMQPPPPFYDPGLRSYSRRRPVRICRRRPRRSRRCRPVIHVIDSSSCSSLSSYTTISSCSRRRHRSHSHSHSRRRAITPQPQQPIILLPMPCQQTLAPAPAPTPAIAAPMQSQPQQIILPPIQIQQSGQLQPQQLALPGIPFQQQQLALPPISFQQQQQPLALSPIQFNSSNFMSSASPSPIMIPSGQPMIQPSMSLPQISNITTQGQPIQGGVVQYVQGGRQTSSPLQYISSQPRSTVAPQRVLVNSTNKRPSTASKLVPRSTSTRELPQNDLKYGRRPFDWYDKDKQNKIINENVQVGQRGSTALR